MIPFVHDVQKKADVCCRGCTGTLVVAYGHKSLPLFSSISPSSTREKRQNTCWLFFYTMRFFWQGEATGFMVEASPQAFSVGHRYQTGEAVIC